MRNKKGKGDGAAAGAASTTPLSGASNTSCYLQVVGLGTDTGDAVPGALLFFDRRRLLFNSGEGLQRYAIEHGLKLAKLSDVLLTRLTPDASGGLPGLCLSTAEARGGGSRALCAAQAAAANAGGGFGYGNVGGGSNNTPIRVCGPRGLASLVGALRTFVDTSVQAVEAVEFADAAASSSSYNSCSFSLPPVIEDDDVKVVPVVVALGGTAAEGGKGGGEEEENRPKRARLEGGGNDKPPSRSFPSAPLPPPPIPAVCYACELSSIPGKFKPEAALALGVPRGPLWGRLKAGQSVEVEVEEEQGEGGAKKKKTVNPEQVAEASLPGPVALVIDCPSVEHARAMASSPAFQRWSKGGGEGEKGEGEAFARLAVVLHLTPDPRVVASEEYAALCRRFDGGGKALGGGGSGDGGGSGGGGEAGEGASSSTTTLTTLAKQVFANGSATRGATILSSSAALAARLNAVNPKLFPLHRLGEKEGEETTGLVATSTSSPSPSSVVAGGNLLKFHLRPAARLGADASAVPGPLDVSAIQEELRGSHAAILEEAARAAAEAEEATKMAKKNKTTEEATENGTENAPLLRTPSLPESRRGEAELVFLGTGAAAPSKYRNVTGTLLRLRRRARNTATATSNGAASSLPSSRLPQPPAGLLLDCGEGSLGQLTRAFGCEEGLAAVRSLELIWVSHIHADHHAGLPRLLMARARAVAEMEEKRGKEGAKEGAGAGAAEAGASNAFSPPSVIPILGPRPLRRVLAAYEHVCGGPGSLRYEFFDNGDVSAAVAEGEAEASAAAGKGSSSHLLSSPSSSLLPPLVSRAMSRLGLGKLVPVRVFHCAHSFGLIVEQEREVGGEAAGGEAEGGGKAAENSKAPPPIPPIKLSFSGDTRRCPALELAASGSHLLVHEATFEDGLEGEALAKNHSTTSDAVLTGRGARAAATLLTHFSQRYPKVPAVDTVVGVGDGDENDEEENKKEKKNLNPLRSSSNVGVAFDLLKVDVVDAATLLPALTGPLRRLFDALEGGGGDGGGGGEEEEGS